MNTYNIYKNGELAVSNATVDIVRITTGINPGNVTRYFDGKQYLAKDGNSYSFEYSCEPVKQNRCKDIINDEKLIRMSPKWINDWNNAQLAAESIKAGTHHIVSKYVKGKWVRVTEAIR